MINLRCNIFSDGAISQGFMCKCKASFTGRRCQRRRNECHPNPCQNRGKCHLAMEPSGMYGVLVLCKIPKLSTIHTLISIIKCNV